MIYVTNEFIETRMENMSDRLRKARLEAGFNTASDAARKFGWTKTTYIAHENGQNDHAPTRPSRTCPARVTPT